METITRPQPRLGKRVTRELSVGSSTIGSQERRADSPQGIQRLTRHLFRTEQEWELARAHSQFVCVCVDGMVSYFICRVGEKDRRPENVLIKRNREPRSGKAIALLCCGAGVGGDSPKWILSGIGVSLKYPSL